MEAMVGLQNRWEHLSDYRTRTWITTFDHDMDSQMAFRDFNNAILMSPDLFKGDHARIKQQISTATTDDDLQTLVGFHIGLQEHIGVDIQCDEQNNSLSSLLHDRSG